MKVFHSETKSVLISHDTHSKALNINIGIDNILKTVLNQSDKNINYNLNLCYSNKQRMRRK